MTNQALNSLELYKGNPISTIKRGLSIQNKSVVKELMNHFKVSDVESLAVKLALQ